MAALNKIKEVDIYDYRTQQRLFDDARGMSMEIKCYSAEFIDFEGHDGHNYKGLCVHFDSDVNGNFRHFYVNENNNIDYDHN